MNYQSEVKNIVLFLNSFCGSEIEALSKKLNFFTKAKNKNSLIINRLLSSYKGKNFYISLFKHENVIVKTINLSDKNIPEESMSFSAFDFNKIIKENWETSEIRNYFKNHFLFCVFKRHGCYNYFVGSFLWDMPENDLENSVKKVREKTVAVLLSGDVVKNNEGKIKLNFPKESEYEVCHVRPHGRNSLDINLLPIKDLNTSFRGLSKQSFWLNKKYLKKVIDQNCRKVL